MSTQITTTGKNLLDPNLTHWTTYTLSVGTRKGILIPVTEGTYNYHNAVNIDMRYGWVDDASDVAGTYIDGADITAHLTAGVQITADSTHSYILLSTWTGTAQALMYEREPMLEHGATNTGYEPYTGGTASPRLDWPQPILSIDECELNVAGKNIANPTSTTSSKTAHGVTSTWDGEKLTVSGTADTITVDFVEVRMSNSPILFAGNTYTFSLQGTFAVSDGTTTFYYKTSKLGETYETTRWLFGGVGQNSWRLTPSEDMVLRSFVLRVGRNTAGFTVNIAANFQLELGSNATTYKPYQGHTISLLPEDTSLRSLPDGTKDELRLAYLKPSKHEG